MKTIGSGLKNTVALTSQFKNYDNNSTKVEDSGEFTSWLILVKNVGQMNWLKVLLGQFDWPIKNIPFALNIFNGWLTNGIIEIVDLGCENLSYAVRYHSVFKYKCHLLFGRYILLEKRKIREHWIVKKSFLVKF